MQFILPSKITEVLRIRLVDFRISAGFPSPATDYEETRIDLLRELVKNPSFTFYIRTSGDSMSPTINDGDLLIVDKKIAQTDGSIVVVSVNNEYCVRRLYQFSDGSKELRSDNLKYKPIHIGCEFEGGFEIFGSVIYSIQDTRKDKR